MTSRSKLLIKILVGLGAVALLVVLFIRSAVESRATPYTVEANHLRGWTPAVVSASRPEEPMLLLVPPGGLVGTLSNQIFRRNMESMGAAIPQAIPLVTQGEFERFFAGRIPPDALLAVARAAGLDEALAAVPRCLAHRRVSDPRANRQLYFAVFDMPQFGRFRADIARLTDGGFDPGALSPVLFIAVAESMLANWLPFRPEAKDCIAPIATAG